MPKAQWKFHLILKSLMGTATASSLALGTAAVAQEFNTEQSDTEVVLAPDGFSPYAGRNFPQVPLWGDSHLHTMVSVDAGTMTRLSQEDAFRFARGEEVTTTHGLRAKLSRPLDWLVVSDHAEMYGLMPQLLGEMRRSCPRPSVKNGTKISPRVIRKLRLKLRWRLSPRCPGMCRQLITPRR